MVGVTSYSSKSKVMELTVQTLMHHILVLAEPYAPLIACATGKEQRAAMRLIVNASVSSLTLARTVVNAKKDIVLIQEQGSVHLEANVRVMVAMKTVVAMENAIK